jgi:hypothetical protein
MLKSCKLFEPPEFADWAKKFEASHEGEEALTFMEDALYRRAGGYAPELRSIDDLKYAVLRACFDAAHYDDTWYKRKRKGKRAVAEPGYNPIELIDHLLNFIETYPETADRVAASWVPNVFDRKHPHRKMKGLLPQEKLQRTFKKLKEAFGEYHKQPIEPIYMGCLLFPHLREPKYLKKASTPFNLHDRLKGLADPACDGLIFELAILIRRYVSQKPLPSETELPRVIRFAQQNEVIAYLVNATLDRDLYPEDVKARLDWLRRKGARFVDWENYYQNPSENPTS